MCYMTIFEYEIEAEPDGRGTKLEGLVTISETTIDRRDNDLAVLLLHGAGGDLHGGHLDDTSDYLAWMGVSRGPRHDEITGCPVPHARCSRRDGCHEGA